MTVKKDYYDILGVHKNASADQIKKVYRKLALKYHPDRNKGNKESEEKFKEISESYEVLNNSSKRQRYDQFGHDGLKSSFGPGGFNFSRDFTHFSDLNDIFGGLFGQNAGSAFDEFFGGRSGRHEEAGSSHSTRGSDLRFDLEIDFEESAFGSKRDITLPISEECDRCKGTGSEPGRKKEVCKHCNGHGVVITSSGFFRVQQECPSCGGKGEIVIYPCNRCHGAGTIKKRKGLTLKIPPGVETGSRLRLAGKGEGGVQGGPSGDLYVVLHVQPHNLFQRQDTDLFCDVFIPLAIAILGGDVSVPTLDGFAKIKIAPGTENGKIFRLRGKGFPDIGRHRKGNLHIRVIIETPKRLSGNQKRKLQEFLDTCKESNYPEIINFQKRTQTFLEYKKRKNL